MTININHGEKTRILESILSSLYDWDGSSESAVEIIASNEPYFTQLKNLEEEETNDNREVLLEIHHKIVIEQKKLLLHIRQEHNKLKKQLGQVSKKNKVVSNYMSLKNNSIFVDRNM